MTKILRTVQNVRLVTTMSMEKDEIISILPENLEAQYIDIVTLKLNLITKILLFSTT